MSTWAKVPLPMRPRFVRIPIAPVALIHLVGDMAKELRPASTLKASNSIYLNFVFLIFFHVPRNLMVLRFLIQFLMTSDGLSLLYRARLVSEMKSPPAVFCQDCDFNSLHVHDVPEFVRACHVCPLLWLSFAPSFVGFSVQRIGRFG